MPAAANMVEVAALVGDTARATMLAALMGGQALTASELADLAHVSRATASGHLAKLAAARLVAVTSKRRFRYYRLASPLVAQMLESIKLVAALEVPPRYQPRSARDDALRFARTCYDHIAGRLGVAIADALVGARRDRARARRRRGHRGRRAAAHRIRRRARASRCSRRIFCRPCLDWSERRYHVAGHVGAEICRRCLERGWVERRRDSRALRLTPAGAIGLAETFGVTVVDDARPPRPPDQPQLLAPTVP